jgi:hypothetical protein
MKGVVCELVDVPYVAESMIVLGQYIEVDLDEGLELMQDDIFDRMSINRVPLEGAEIAIGLQEVIEENGSDSYLWKTRSDNNGYFDDFWDNKTEKGKYIIKVSKPGYKEVIRVIKPGEFHLMIALLVIDS